MDPTSIKEELSYHKESEGEQATEDRENSDEASNLTTPLSAPNGKQNNAAKRPTQLNRCDSVGTESESSSRTNSPQMERASYKQVICLLQKNFISLHRHINEMHIELSDSYFILV